MSIIAKQLTKEEIAAIRHQITPIHLVKNISMSTTYLDAEPCNSAMACKTRRENINKLR